MSCEMMATGETNAYYSVKQIAEELGVNHKLIRKLVFSGKLEGYKVGGAIRISKAALNAYLENVKINKPLPVRAATKPNLKRRRQGGFKFL
jgi:excisionase family DNA binding protein